MKLKKTLCIGLMAGVVITSAIPTFADTYKPIRPAIKIKVDNQYIETDVLPEIKENKTYVPISFITQRLGASVKWEVPKTIIEKDNVTLEFEIDKYNIIRNGIKYPQTTAAYIKDGRTMVPLRVVSEFLGCQVGYDNENKIVSITKRTGAIEAPEIDTSNFILSPDKKWGVDINDDQNLYLLNVETNEVQKLYSEDKYYDGKFKYDSCGWSEDSKLGVRFIDKNEYLYKLYDPSTNTSTPITEEEYDKVGFPFTDIFFVEEWKNPTGNR